MARSEMDISRVVRTLLTHQSRTRAELAQYLGLHVSAINKSLAEPIPRRGWSAEEVAGLSEFFDLPVELFYDDPDNLVRKTCFLPDLMSA